MRRGPRGGPGEFEARLVRAERLLEGGGADTGAAREPLTVLAAVLRHQLDRVAATAPAPARAEGDQSPLLDLDAIAPAVVIEVALAAAELTAAVPAPLRDSAIQLRALAASEAAAVIETWLDDVTLVEPRLGFWIRVAAGPALELGARSLTVPDRWNGRACPMCGGQPAASVIAEESGEFMAGSPRSLVCGRCAAWWPFARTTCVVCGDDDSRHLESFLVEERSWARVDTCATCHSYVKTFDLRERGAVDVIPLVDDVATLTLDVWAQHRGYGRPSASLAGV